MQKYDILIIGSGLGGLICASILSKNGYNVCVLEKNHQIGGSIQNFSRDGVVFDTGAHYVGGLDEGQNLYQYFKYLGLNDKLNVKKLDINAFDIISFGDDKKDYPFAMGYENFKNQLEQYFPEEREALNNYIDKFIEISNVFPLYKLKLPNSSFMESEYFKISTNSFLNKLTKNIRLRNVLAGTNLLYAGETDKTPLYIHSLINNSYIESAYRFVGGSSQMAELLSDTIKQNGGTIIKNSEVQEFLFKDKTITAVKLANGEEVYADNFISNIHPARTFEMMPKDKLRKVYRNRICELENTISVFTLYITLKENSFNYLNQNIYYYKQNNVWTASTYDKAEWPESYMLLTQASDVNNKYANGITVMAYMKYNELKKWENTTVEKRGSDYKEFKQKKADELLNLIEEKFPDIRKHIKSVYTSTPLTYRDYIATKDGSLYGILRDCNEPIKSIILPKTNVPNLYLTGQNVNLHGVLGVTIGAVLTCAEFIGMDNLITKIKSVQ
ncbi:MAG: NAD(P)/FAD-dependent oxidoreductase [Bacteroidales bacterium]|nr:NAD(P)/FAD-dependent oxidoreductase [Bacteroidales bacterium]